MRQRRRFAHPAVSSCETRRPVSSSSPNFSHRSGWSKIQLKTAAVRFGSAGVPDRGGRLDEIRGPQPRDVMPLRRLRKQAVLRWPARGRTIPRQTYQRLEHRHVAAIVDARWLAPQSLRSQLRSRHERTQFCPHNIRMHFERRCKTCKAAIRAGHDVVPPDNIRKANDSIGD